MATVACTEVMTPSRVAATNLAALHLHQTESDPVVYTATRLLSIPLRQVYALAWRAGFLTIR